ncbi:MAG: ATP-binding protein [Deltaproteobacteria bacterium]|nr:ATP-binding protein [Deltaproteobacteria bacterium]
MENRCHYSRLTVPADQSYLDVVAAYVGQTATLLGFDEQDRRSIEVATREATANVVDHAFAQWENGNIEISCERVPLGLQIVVKDLGEPFDPDSIPECPQDRDSATESIRGCGVFTMKDSMDEVHFRNLGPNGKETVMVKYLKTATIADYVAACELGHILHDEEQVPAEKHHVNVVIRAMEPSEAIEVCKCVYRAYGYSYTFEDLYYPDRIIALNKSGKVYSAVAVTDQGEVAGHAALVKYHENAMIAETAVGVVKPEFRSQGILNRFEEHLIDKARSMGLMGLFGRPVTTHTYSQQVGLRYGMRDCAILLGYVPQTASFRGIAQKLLQRETLLTHFMYLTEPSRLAIFPPNHHADMIARLYAQLGVHAEIPFASEDSADPIDSDAVLNTAVYGSSGIAKIEVKRNGKNAIPLVRRTLHDLRIKHVDVIHLYLSLFDPQTSGIVKPLEDLGFFFAGILPGALPDDALILQYLNNVPFDYSRVKVASETAQELLSYIERLDPNRV